jgi:HEAT repeat protein
MLSPTSIDRLVELYIANRADANFTRIAATVLRYSHPVGTDEALRHLIEEKNAGNRLALLRLISQIGPTCLEHARKYLSDERWYVVRNMCNIMAELRDPELAKNVAESLKHPDARVQQAALNALTKSRTEGRAELISVALEKMAAVVQEQALDELLFLKSVGSLPELEKFVGLTGLAPIVGRKALQVIANTPGDESTLVIHRLAERNDLQDPLRKFAGELLQRRKPN